MFIHTDDITTYIPQRTPIVMISGILEVDGPLTRTGLHIAPDNIFVENGVLTAPGLMENIAQTAAARIGYIAKQQNTPVPLGFIGAVKDLEILELPPAGQTIETTTVIGGEVFNATMVTGKVTYEGRVMAQCEMKIFINPQL
ncbi:3-hydroxyacyl-ACP dehydratase [Chitinophaga polysaccharea]|uniref:3-hydroxyacyl-ACP dehydratase n=1 Tax=Chitinophaga TaxID=79328 RepID=UPI0014554B63|nr:MULTISPECIES: 3-hydroxyacyl-ACP dehydratase [Chitinophaga]NLR61174.1 3-hydroxyacyl-ACP dehydratase [Chitinophaga polysaccharea]NLU95012.1 3-hydroxyacyl-ACP dehydratase [Chitinophaga sp. Ak27]